MEIQTTSNLWRILIAGVLIVHGLGHVGGPWFFTRSWLSPALTTGALRWVFIVLWLIAGVGFVASGVGLLTYHSWWRTLAVAAAVLALPITLLYLGGVAAANKLAAVIVDVAILVCLLVLKWPPVELVGS